MPIIFWPTGRTGSRSTNSRPMACSACKRNKPLVDGAPTGERRGKKPPSLCGRCWREGIILQMMKLGRTDFLIISNMGLVTDQTEGLEFVPLRAKHDPSYTIGYKIRPKVQVWFYGPDDTLWYGVTSSFDGRARCRRIKHTRWNRKTQRHPNPQIVLPLVCTQRTVGSKFGSRRVATRRASSMSQLEHL